MPQIFRVSHTQMVRYWWYVEADTEAEATATDQAGIPDIAFHKTRSSETEAEPLADGDTREDRSILTLTRWNVRYVIAAGIESPPLPVAEGVVTVRALSHDIAVDLAEHWITDHDGHYDDRIQPRLTLTAEKAP